MFAAIQGNRAHGRTAIDRQPGGPAINEGAQQQMILSRADKRQCFKLRRCPRESAMRRSSQFDDQTQGSAANPQQASCTRQMI
jgi:hypothetical protein